MKSTFPSVPVRFFLTMPAIAMAAGECAGLWKRTNVIGGGVLAGAEFDSYTAMLRVVRMPTGIKGNFFIQ
jgi:hypothetical protein